MKMAAHRVLLLINPEGGVEVWWEVGELKINREGENTASLL